MEVGMVTASEAVKVINNNSEMEYYDRLHSEKYRDKGQSFINHACNIAVNIGTNQQQAPK